MILASAQTKPTRYNIKKNLHDHYRMIEVAGDYGSKLIAFPEMSITGYERDKAGELAFSKTDSRLDKLRTLAADKNMIIIAGAPIKVDNGMFIGSFILFPDQTLSFYTKQFLHHGEEDYFSPSFNFNPLLELDDERISLAICADIDNPLHPENASKLNTSIYIPSIFFSPVGVPDAYKNLSNYASKYSMNILMSNFCGESWGKPSGGRSAFWDSKGELIGSMNDSDPGLLIAEKKYEQWNVKCFF